MAEKEVIRTVLVDDHEVVRRGIREFLEESGDIVVVAEASDGDHAVALIETEKPDVVVLDIQMPGRSGIEVTRWIREQGLPVGVLILTAYDDDPYVMAVLDAGANGFVLKSSSPADIIRAVRDVVAGLMPLDPAITGKLMHILATQDATTGKPVEELTPRELEVLHGAASGLTNKAIGFKLGISDRTVQGHMANAFQKLDAANRTDAVLKAILLGLIDSPDG